MAKMTGDDGGGEGVWKPRFCNDVICERSLTPSCISPNHPTLERPNEGIFFPISPKKGSLLSCSVHSSRALRITGIYWFNNLVLNLKFLFNPNQSMSAEKPHRIITTSFPLENSIFSAWVVNRRGSAAWEQIAIVLHQIRARKVTLHDKKLRYHP